MNNEICKVIQNKQLVPGIFEMIIQSTNITISAVPGQFLHIKINSGLYPLLRRPISISSIDKLKHEIAIVYHVVGQGTEELSKLQAGTELNVMGPLGKGFPLLKNNKCAVVGGGMGTAPLLELTKNLPQCDAYLGFKNCTYKIKSFENSCHRVFVATEDGSVGYKGYITELLEENIKRYELIYTCGPKLMMQKVIDICKRNNVECFVSIEERMGCGIGACLVCACKIKEANGEWHYKKACKDGPVFNAKEVLLND